MKKFISMVMAAAMVVSLVPATAFAANAATFKVVGDLEWTKETADNNKNTVNITGPEVQIKLADVNNVASATGDSWKIKLDFENAEFNNLTGADDEVLFAAGADISAAFANSDLASGDVTVKVVNKVEEGDDSIEFKITEVAEGIAKDDIFVIDLSYLNLVMTKSSDVTVTVSGKFGDSDAMTVVALKKEGLDVTLKKVAEVAAEEEKALKSDLILETAVSTFATGQIIELKLNSGFEWKDWAGTVPAGLTYDSTESEDDCLVFNVTGAGYDKFTFDKDDLVVDAVDAKVGDVAKITVKVKEGTSANGFKDTVTVEAVKVVAEDIKVSVDEDEDVPVMYSGVAPTTTRLNVEEDDFTSLEVTIKESVKGALDVKKDLNLMLPEGVYVTDVNVTEDDGVAVSTPAGSYDDAVHATFAAAYEEGKHEGFVFDRKTFTATDDASVNEEMELSFELQLMAEPGFEGDVVLTVSGGGMDDEQEVTIAKFVSPYTVEAQANDLIIDYRNTEVPTNVVVKEAEAGLWANGANAMDFVFSVDHMEFEKDATIEVNKESEMKVKAVAKEEMGFYVDEESDEEAAVVTISGISLYMSRNLAAGAYDLDLTTKAGREMMQTKLYTTEDGGEWGATGYYVADIAGWAKGTATGTFVPEAVTVKEGFINIITAGRDKDDASFTTKVVVPVGEMYIVAGEQTVALDVPAYVSASGYTMLPVRAVAVALGILNNNVLWDQATKTVTILYGQRIITMTVGAKVINVNGSAIPASSSPEVVDGRTFLPMRDLATALGVTDITWDAATKTATLNGNK